MNTVYELYKQVEDTNSKIPFYFKPHSTHYTPPIISWTKIDIPIKDSLDWINEYIKDHEGTYKIVNKGNKI